jgi:hypothetical protein
MFVARWAGSYTGFVDPRVIWCNQEFPGQLPISVTTTSFNGLLVYNAPLPCQQRLPNKDFRDNHYE